MSTAKLNILKETFENSFDIDRFRKFTREFFNETEILPEIRHTGIWKEYEEHINSYYTIAKYCDNEDNNLIVMAVELKNDKSIERARSMQRNFISKILDENNLEAGIVAFYSQLDSNWRLSLVRLDYSFTDKGIKLDLTPARRYSYLVGENEPNHTAQEQLLPIFEDDKHNPTLDEIENAFSVERVTKDFFNQYREKYLALKEYIEKDESFITETEKLGFEVSKFSEQFSKKLMGQSAFLYFLQKKGWLGVRIMPENHTLLEEEFQKVYMHQDSVHKAILERVLKKSKEGNRKLSSRELFSLTEHEGELLSDCFINTKYDMPWGSGDKKFIRGIFEFCTNNTNKNFFNDYLEPFFYDALNRRRSNQYFKKFNCKIPFLNGGLFEPLEGYHWKDVEFEIPNELFSNVKEKGREADGILDIFDRFNFTMNEDEPLEKEVAVDPEMLGKIFENLLDVSDRKSKGAFYTPREIVHYMCQESLINYLVNEVNVPYEDMKEFIFYGELIRDADNRKDVGYGKKFTVKQSILEKIVDIDDALKRVRVADPSVGSGAFPLGMLNEIVRARNNITEYIIRKDKEGAFDRKFGEKFIRKWRSPYRMKWETIKNSIFAVDIEPSAVDIAKLRLWLSVVVEQEIDDENPEPHPLPNLDCNILVGNSLIDEYEGIKLFDESILYKHKNEEAKKAHEEVASAMMQMSLLIDHSDDMLKEMFELQDRLFDEDNERKKKEIKAQIEKIRDDLIKYKLTRDGNKEALKKYDEMKKLKMKPFFIWQLEFAKIFKEKGGFDIVIGNPPYIYSREKFSSKEKEVYYKFETADYQLNTFVLFIEKGIKILRQNGIKSYIIPNSILKITSMSKSRRFMLNQGSLINILQFFGQSFENVNVETVVLVFKKAVTEDKQVKIINVDELCNLYEKDVKIIDYSKWLNDEECRFQVSIDKESDLLLEKIVKMAEPLEKKFEVKSGLKAYEKGKGNPKQTAEDVKNRPYDANYKVNDNTYPYLEGRDIQRYSFNWSGGWLQYGKILAAPRKFNIFSVPRLLIREITGIHPKSILCCYFEETYLNNLSIINVVSKCNNIDETKCLMLILNSKLMSYYFNKTTPKSERKMFPKLILKDLRQFPIIIPDDKTKMVELADEMLNLHGKEKVANEEILEKLELEVNQMIYQLYNLNSEDINLIEKVNK